MGKMTRSESGKLGAEASRAICNQKFEQRKREYANNPSKCLKCGIDLSYTQRHNKFCSRSCSISFSNRGTCHNGIPLEPNKRCLFCGGSLKGKSREQKFCSNHCCNKYKWNEVKNKIKNGSAEFGIKIIRKYLLETRGAKCESCGFDFWIGEPITLQIDHIDGNATNNKLDNLRLLCPNCHSLTPTFGSRNKGNGRHYRRLAREKMKEKYGWSD